MKTFSELGITPEEHLALQAVAAGLASGEYVNGYDLDAEGEKIFDMYMQCASRDCGTVGCIGGWVGREMGLSIQQASDYVGDIHESDSLIEDLYYPEIASPWSSITPAIAAEGIYNFLETGHPDFETLLAAPAVLAAA